MKIKNIVYIIGDDSNKDTFKDNKCVIHIHINSFTDNSLININRMKSCFVNYSTNPHTYELNCFLRIFYLKELINLTKIDTFFHVDSDCIILERLKKIPFKSSICYSLQDFCQKSNPYHMVGCIHNGLLNSEFCDKFMQLCFDIYENKSKFHLIEPKINWHKTQNIIGGICDMTLYYLIHAEKLVDMSNLNDIIYIDEDCTFDHQICGGYGYLGEKTYMLKNGIKEIIRKDNKFYIKTHNNTLIRTLSFHFQSNTKSILENLNEADF